MSRDLFNRIVEKKERQKEKRNEELRDRVRHESKDTLNFYNRKRNQGWTPREIMRDIGKSMR